MEFKRQSTSNISGERKKSFASEISAGTPSLPSASAYFAARFFAFRRMMAISEGFTGSPLSRVPCASRSRIRSATIIGSNSEPSSPSSKSAGRLFFGGLSAI